MAEEVNNYLIFDSSETRGESWEQEFIDMPFDSFDFEKIISPNIILLNCLNKDKIRDITVLLNAYKQIHSSWRKCLILLFNKNLSPQAINSFWQSGGDKLIDENDLNNTIEQTPSAESNASEDYKLQVFIAENHIDTSMLFKEILASFCDIVPIISQSSNSLRDLEKLSSKGILEYIAWKSVDILIIDLALSYEQEQTAKNMKKHFISKMAGMIAIKIIRKDMHRFFPIAVVSNYVSDKRFPLYAQQYLGKAIFDTIKFIDKTPAGRKELKTFIENYSKRIQ